MSHDRYLTPPAEAADLHYPLEDSYSLAHGLYIKEIKKGYAVIAADIKPYMINAHGVVHGGLIALLADDAAGIASHTLALASVTMGMSINYLKGATSNCRTLLAVGKIRHGGRRTHVVDIEVCDQDDQLIATGTATYFVTQEA